MSLTRAGLHSWTPFALLALSTLANSSPVTVAPKGCKNIPGDAGWPTIAQWDQLNTTVGGRLIKTIPLGSPCYQKTYNVADYKYDISTYDEASCQANVIQNWHEPTFHDQSSSSVMQTYFANNSCNPINGQGDCGIGSYVQYAINVTGDQDALAGISFAQKYNIRLLVRNTGHDYLGKSTGYGALALWTHHLKAISPVKPYRSSAYTGPALQVSAGVQVSEVYDFLESQQYMAVGGECPSVGIAGGYIFAGGHAPTSSKLGLAADGILEIEGILANGTSFTATPSQHQDLYWFLSGSGAGGTVAYIKSVTFRIFKDFSVSGSILTFNYTGVLNETEFWPLVETWHNITPRITDAGAYAYAFYVSGYLQVWPLFAPTLTPAETVALLKPLTDALDGLKKSHKDLAYNLTSTTYPTFNSAYKGLFPHLGSGTLQWSNRLIPRTIVETQSQALSKTFKSLFDDGATMIEAVMNPNLEVANPVAKNSVLPAWRNNIIDVVVGKAYNDSAPFQQMADDRTYITQHWTSALEALAPVSQGGGSYMNEADAEDPNWQASFYGHYQQQLAIKRQYDPTGVWYAKTAVGSEYYAEDVQQRLCKVTPVERS